MGGIITEPITIKEIAQYIGSSLPAELDGERIITSVTTDSRKADPKSLFIPLKGEKVDGADFIPSVYEKGGISLAPEGYSGSEPVLRVEDPLGSYLKLAAAYRERFHPLVVGVTGSVGKTTCKELIACVLEQKYKTLKTLGNRNNEIGMPETLLRLDHSYEAAVIEMGMCGFGEIEELTLAARPSIGFISMIGVSHMELLGSRENICKAKMEIVRGMEPDGTLILNGEDDLLNLVTEEQAGVRILRFGFHEGCDAWADHIRQDGVSMRWDLHWNGRSYPATVPAIGRHMVLDAVGAFLVGVTAGLEAELCLKGLSLYQPAGMRQKVVTHNGFTVIEDCYNASPDSMKASLKALRDFPASGKKIAVLGDMLELGKISESSHFEVGEEAAERADVLLSVGEFAAEMVRGAKEKGLADAQAFADKGSLFAALKCRIEPGDTVLVKASNGMKLDEIIRKIYEEC